MLVPVLLFALVSSGAQQTGNASTPTEPRQAGVPDNPVKKSDQAVLTSEQYSDAIAKALLSRIAGGFTRRNPKLLLSAFEAERLQGYRLFADRVRARLSQHQGFRAYYRILDTAVQDSRITVRTELQIEENSATIARPPTRSTGQASFVLERGAAGWRIVDVTPRDLLTGIRP